MLYPICYVLYAGCHMPRLICQFLYVEYHMPASYCEFAIRPIYMPISVPVYACSVTDLTCQLQYICIYMPAHECQIFVVRCQVCLYANLGCFILLYLSLYAKCFMSYTIYRVQWAICQTPYARLKYAKCYDHCYVF
jgi:hypothetical protein